MTLLNEAARWEAYPMGPRLRRWLHLPPEKQGPIAKQAAAEEPRADFQAFIIAFSQAFPSQEVEELSDLMDELLGMNLPLAVLKLVDANPGLDPLRDFRSLLIEGLAAMISEELERAELCFQRAQRLIPLEPAPYSNMVQILQSKGCWQDALAWLQVGLEACPTHLPLWELFWAQLEQTYSHDGAQVFTHLLAKARSLHSWAGMALAAELDPHKNQDTKAFYLEPFYQAGERSSAFLTEYTGALGIAGEYAKIPSIVWQAEKMTSSRLPWQLQFHRAQAHLAQHESRQFLSLADYLFKDPDLPEAVSHQLAQLVRELSHEQEAPSQ